MKIWQLGNEKYDALNSLSSWQILLMEAQLGAIYIIVKELDNLICRVHTVIYMPRILQFFTLIHISWTTGILYLVIRFLASTLFKQLGI